MTQSPKSFNTMFLFQNSNDQMKGSRLIHAFFILAKTLLLVTASAVTVHVGLLAIDAIFSSKLAVVFLWNTMKEMFNVPSEIDNIKS